MTIKLLPEPVNLKKVDGRFYFTQGRPAEFSGRNINRDRAPGGLNDIELWGVSFAAGKWQPTPYVIAFGRVLRVSTSIVLTVRTDAVKQYRSFVIL